MKETEPNWQANAAQLMKKGVEQSTLISAASVPVLFPWAWRQAHWRALQAQLMLETHYSSASSAAAQHT